MFLKERSPISVKEVRNLADKYRTAHPSKPIAKEVEIVANVGGTKESIGNQQQFNRTSRRDKWQQNNQRSNSCGPNWKQRDYAQPNQRCPRWNDSPHNNFRRQNKGNFRGYSQRRPSRGRGMPSRSNYHDQRYEYASSASILFNKSDKTSQHQLNIVSGKINGINATKKRVCSRFSWPCVIRDVNKYVKSCDICQRNCNKLPNLPIQIADIIDRPFDKVAIDIVGPMMMSDSKNRFILTLVDAATRWPEAVPLKSISTTDVANALFNIFTRLGLPKEILSDNGQQLVSKAMEEVVTMMGIQRRLSTPYHAQSNGMVERFNGS
ncbi:gypsy retrotransposon integrase-like protein 1 [Plakobranchus ocellatus]|uniref:Gypsy retrotransposon integrase-like protein 1 n=1 Tax=Plakobranchus ocellatus TaxID=259542 RepID=A0AAV4CW71_9GAST|nr:gypsy retrotransposon integrase-like protein 1 [Plakobranchus ocellatus]